MAKGSYSGPGGEPGDAAPATPSHGRRSPSDDDSADGRSALLEHLARGAGHAGADGERSRVLAEALASMAGGAEGRSALLDQLARPGPAGESPELTRLAAALLSMQAPGADGRSALLDQLASPGAGGGDAGPAPTVADLVASLLAAPEGRSAILQQLARAGSPAAAPARPATPARELAPGAVVGRFELVKELGRGGFGVVFEARDRELNRSVAFKAVRPGVRTRQLDTMLLQEAESAARLQHENIVAIYDYGQGDAGPYLVLELLRGQTLASRIAHGAMPVREVVHVGTQVARALAHAHGAGLLHRDLKPGNVFLTESGGVKVMDLGLAHFFGQPTGLSGTPAYMAPEQWKGEAQDGRTDVFALGVTLFEMLSGRRPYEVRSDRSTVLDPGPEPRLEHAHVPARLRKLVERCIAKDPAKRPASARAVQEELLAIERDLGKKEARRGQFSLVLVLGGILGVLGIGGAAAWKLWPREIAKGAPRTVLVADFENRTGEEVFDGTLEPAIGIALEGASFVNTYKRQSALGVANKLQLAGTGLPESRARLVAQREGIHVVVAGGTSKSAKGYEVEARAIDGFTGKSITERKVEVGSKDEVLAAASKLAAHVRTALGDGTPEAVQLKEAETYGAASLEAAHAYGLGRQAEQAGEYEVAKKHFLDAVRLDPAMGRAYVGLGNVEGNLGRHTASEKHYQAAWAHLDRMTDREKNRSRGAYYLQTRDVDKAIEAFSAVVKQYPADNSASANLAVAYQLKRQFEPALKEARHAISISPRNVPQRNNVGLFAMYLGKFDEAIAEQKQVIELGPTFENGYKGLALAQLAGGQREDAIATWERLRGLSDDGAAAAAEGLADLAMLEGRLGDARQTLETGLQLSLARKDGDGAGRKLVMLAEVELAAGKPAKAIPLAERAIASSREDFVMFGAARALAEAGQEKKALALADELQKRLSQDAQMYADLVRGTAALRRKAGSEAVNHFKAAAQHGDAWLTRVALGRAYLDSGAPAQALDELEKADARRGEATDVSLDLVPTYRYYGPVLYYLGRAREELKAPSAADSYRAFLALQRTDEPVLVADARSRVASR
ncbi:MAG TPA: protein kinase [Anaeromyxobacteraceae bacterium]|nr:protein kinase [Anaeromyxobacteraceae bacterium]